MSVVKRNDEQIVKTICLEINRKVVGNFLHVKKNCFEKLK
jgi:hypothetical protein